ncbi:hypothetical protein DSO57_1024571 [Entomophthora muscae]|uniref:Uncharacterized protein n=1 Tax=Entomophthora muscae TaxID=34485 RepID=A0ACC2S4K0_9FUNG|nr:hypothetical protein DSO57_1024571 [Entomophthora muscae]
MSFGQLVIGPPGSGKTTYCRGMKEFLEGLGRKVVLINLDPANEFIPYTPDIDINDLITLDDAMREESLGPNGAMIFCLEFLEKNLDWLVKEMKKFPGGYFLIDSPGQVELYTHNLAVKSIFDSLQKLDYRLVAVHLVDSHYCTDLAKFVSVLLVSLKTMVMLELPHVNVLSKVDLMESYGQLAFNLEFYTEVMDLNYLVAHLNETTMGQRYHRLTKAMCDLVQEFGLVNFHPLMIEDKVSMASLLSSVDKAGGYIYGGLSVDNQSIQLSAVRIDDADEVVRYMQDRYLQSDG